jgi:chromate transporter
MHLCGRKPSQTNRRAIWQLLWVWSLIGLQSFGGGASTNLLIQRHCIEKQGWLTYEELQHFRSLCALTPGINLVALTILIGKKLGGWSGILVSLCGFLFPSALITCLIAAGFVLIEQLTVVKAMVGGVIPSTAGIMLLVAIRAARPQLQQAWREGVISMSVSLLLILLTFSAVGLLHITITLVFPALAFIGYLVFSVLKRYHRKGDKKLKGMYD